MCFSKLAYVIGKLVTCLNFLHYQMYNGEENKKQKKTSIQKI